MLRSSFSWLFKPARRLKDLKREVRCWRGESKEIIRFIFELIKGIGGNSGEGHLTVRSKPLYTNPTLKPRLGEGTYCTKKPMPRDGMACIRWQYWRMKLSLRRILYFILGNI
jgi:hypothetical protein